LAAELETRLQASAELLQSSGGVFEVSRDGQLIFSKKALGRFPAPGEILDIVSGLESGLALDEAQARAAAGAPQPPSFLDWLQHFLKRRPAGN